MYLCNAGPSKDTTTASIYITERDAYGKYNVYQRVEVDSEYATTLIKNIDTAEVVGEVVTLSALDRASQIITTIQEMMAQVMLLLKEYGYWKSDTVIHNFKVATDEHNALLILSQQPLVTG